MKMIIFPLLGTWSRRAIRRKYGKFGNPYDYRPRITLVKYLSKKLGMTEAEVVDQIAAERAYLIKDL